MKTKPSNGMLAHEGEKIVFIRRAEEKDIPTVLKLLDEVNTIHHEGRPDLFRSGTKYGSAELEKLFKDDDRPVFVADDGGKVTGYAFCIFEQKTNDRILTPVKTLYIDDLCVEETCRGKHVGRELYFYVLDFAKRSGCYNVTLNVWALNSSAEKFYRGLGMKPLKTYMEQIL